MHTLSLSCLLVSSSHTPAGQFQFIRSLVLSLCLCLVCSLCEEGAGPTDESKANVEQVHQQKKKRAMFPSATQSQVSNVLHVDCITYRIGGHVAGWKVLAQWYFFDSHC